MQIDTLENEREKHDNQRMYRRNRRSRKRYRKPRFDNRRTTKGWLAPSLQHKADIHMYWLQEICNYYPIKRIVMEMGQFDTQILKAMEERKPLPAGEDYQHGERYGTDTLREAVFTRDGYTCQCCGRSIKDSAILHVHHIRYRSQGGTNAMHNLATVCEKCHTPANHKPGGKLYDWKPKLPSFKGATFMTAVRWMLYDRAKLLFSEQEVHITYGAATKRSRLELNLAKSHINDAFVMGELHPKHRSQQLHLKKKRRNNRCLEKFYDARYLDARDGKVKSGQELYNGRISRNNKKNGENLHPYRKEKRSKGRRSIRKQHYHIQPGDTVIFQGTKYKANGCHCIGTRLILDNNKSVSLKKVTLKTYAGGYTVCT